MIEIALQLWKLVTEAIAGALKWLRKPGSKLRLLCGLLACGFLGAGLQSWQRGTIIVQQKAEYVALETSTAKERQELKDALSSRDEKLEEIRVLADRQKALLAQLAAENAQVKAQAAADKARAAESEAKYQQAFQNRPPECAAALQVMAKACPTLEGY